jgi:hypothetical protein
VATLGQRQANVARPDRRHTNAALPEAVTT